MLVEGIGIIDGLSAGKRCFCWASHNSSQSIIFGVISLSATGEVQSIRQNVPEYDRTLTTPFYVDGEPLLRQAFVIMFGRMTLQN